MNQDAWAVGIPPVKTRHLASNGLFIVEGKQVDLRERALVLIQPGERQEIRNSGKKLLKTLNFYVPPENDASGEELPSGNG